MGAFDDMPSSAFADMPTKKETPLWVKAAEFLTGHFGYEKEDTEDELINGQPSPAYAPQNKSFGSRALDETGKFFQDPITALAFGGVAAVAKGGGLAAKALAGGRETLGWVTGGASEVPTLAKSVGKTATKAIDAKPLAELREARQASDNVFATVPISAETGKPIVEALADTAPKASKGAFSDMPYEQAAKTEEKVISKTGDNVVAEGGKTGTRQEIVKKEIAESGRTEISSPTRQALTPDEIKTKVDNGEIKPREIAEEVAKKSRPLSSEEINALGYDRAILKNEHAKLEKQIDNARASGDADTEIVLLEEQAKIESHLKNNDIANLNSSTEWGLSGLAKQEEIAKDYSFSRMVIEAEKTKGSKLTLEERQKFKELSKRIEDANLKIAQYEDKIAAFEAQKSLKRIQNDIALEKRKIKRTYTKVELDTELDGLFKQLNSQLSQVSSTPMFNTEIYKLYGEIAKNRVKAGINTIEALVDEVYTIGKNYGLELSKREVRDAISKYGVVGKLSKDEINVQLRELKRQGRLISALEDAKGGKAPLRSGLLRDEKSVKVIELEKKVKQAMKDSGIDVSKIKTKEQLWKTSVESLKTRLKNDIERITTQLETGAKPSTSVPKEIKLDDEAWRLKNTRDFLKEQLDLLEGKTAKGISDEKRIQIATNKLEKSMSEYIRKIYEGELAAKKSKTPQLNTPELNKLRKDRDFLNSILTQMRTEAKPKPDPFETFYKQYEKRTLSTIAKLEEKIKNKDFAPKPIKEFPDDKRLLELRFKRQQMTNKYQEAKLQYNMDRRTALQKTKDIGMEIVNVTRAIKTSVDLSAVLRQGGFIVLGHPIRGVKAMPEMFKALRSEIGQFAVEQSIMKRQNYDLYQKAGLYLSDHGHELHKMEEAYMSKWADKIPGVAASSRAYTTYLNVLRANSFDAMVKNLPMKAGKPNPEEAKAIANYINVATGRGNLGAKENSLVMLNTAFFAPRYVLSRFQLLTGQPLRNALGTPIARKMIAKEYGRFLIGLSAVYGMSIAMGAKVGVDPHSSDFGKIILGKTRIDPMVGLSQTATFTTRALTGDISYSGKGYTLSSSGIKGRGSNAMNADQYGRVMLNFLRSKIAPVPSAIWSMKTGKDVVGNKIERIGDVEDFLQGTSTPSNLVMPLALSDIYQTMQEQGIPEGTALALLSIFGMGLQTYNKKNK